MHTAPVIPSYVLEDAATECDIAIHQCIYSHVSGAGVAWPRISFASRSSKKAISCYQHPFTGNFHTNHIGTGHVALLQNPRAGVDVDDWLLGRRVVSQLYCPNRTTRTIAHRPLPMYLRL
eukprot:CAMPEP_0173110188 /NCGR_PEP_ID=MMETSP1102-20130122/44128_1 /TAXON_ID=49646 /ORGANISM="Geminigera sp., Strain Caron Lab Isolate" /LENGTH=119 /DNA_ID=CAMNT_0014009729 /DNA_START=396 /DNA_END=752 /DNA_ORIENTATION=+